MPPPPVLNRSITKAVTITSPDGVEAGIVPAAGRDAIDINARPCDSVVLRGLTLNGSDIAFNGVVFNSRNFHERITDGVRA